MPWAAAPDRHPAYTVRTGDGPAAEDGSTYVPGEGMLIYIRTLKYEWRFRGLLMHAVDAQVGRMVARARVCVCVVGVFLSFFEICANRRRVLYTNSTCYWQGKTVGKWSFGKGDLQLFWTPPTCPNTVMHNSATGTHSPCTLPMHPMHASPCPCTPAPQRNPTAPSSTFKRPKRVRW